MGIYLPHYKQFCQKFDAIDRVMIGRGLLVNPAMTCEIQSGMVLTRDTLRAFHDEIYEGYRTVMSGDRNVLFKMKELWFYLIHLFSSPEKAAKKIKKAEKLSAYEKIIDHLFSESDLIR